MLSRPIHRRQVLVGAAGVAGALLTMRGMPNAGLPIATASDPTSDLLRMLAFVPNAHGHADGLGYFLDRWDGWLSFTNRGAVKQLYGFADLRSFDDARQAAFLQATNGCLDSSFTGVAFADHGEYRDAFGYDLFQVEREISAGQPVQDFAHMEGTFDVDTIAAKLRDGGYQPARHADIPYYTVREDSQSNLKDPRSRLMLGQMNRVAVSTGRVAATSTTAIMEGLLDAEAQQTATLADCPTFRALAVALGDVTSMATCPNPSDTIGAAFDPDLFAELTRDWGTLHTPEVVAMGYTDQGDFRRTMHAALVYANPNDAVADAPELVKRLTNYRSLRSPHDLLIPASATAVTSRTVTESDKGVLVADVTLVPEPERGKLWKDMLFGRDTLFLVPNPNAS